jgi:tetratricopeptide (TPR) repeat protein/two-component sensor histidine kinase
VSNVLSLRNARFPSDSKAGIYHLYRMKAALFLSWMAFLLLGCGGGGRGVGADHGSTARDTLSFKAELDSARDLLRKGAIGDAEWIAGRVLRGSSEHRELARQHMQALSMLGQVKQRRAEPDSALLHYRELLRVAEEAQDTFWIGAGWLNIGVVHELKGDYPAALEAGLAALRWKELHGDSASLARVLHNLSVLEWRQDSVARAIDLIERSIAIKRSHEPMDLPSSLAGLGLLLIETQRYDTAILVLKESVALEDSLAEGAERENAIINIALAFERTGRMDSAAHYYRMALLDARVHANPEGMMQSYQGIGEVLSAQGRLSEARTMLDSALVTAQRIDSPEGIKQAHFALGRLHEATGNATGALEHLHAYHALNDSLMNAGTRAAMEELLLRYDSAKKDRENEELRSASTLAALRAERDRWIAVGMGLLAITIVGLALALLQRNRQRARLRETELEQQVLRSQMDPHFLFNALNTIPGLYAGGDPGTANDHVGHLSKYLRLVLETSRRRSIPLAQELALVEHYLRISANRRPGSFTWEVTVKPYVKPDLLSVPPMLIQPLVENALEHGLRGVAKGHVSVLVDLAGTLLRVEVRDNGIGRKAAAHRPSRHQGASMGIDLVRQRILLFDRHAHPAEVVLVSEGDEPTGTTVTLRFRPKATTEHVEHSHR